MTTITLVRGDTATVSMDDLAAAAGVELVSTFEAGDVLAFTLRRYNESPTAILALTSDADVITFDEGESTGEVNIAAGDWQGDGFSHNVTCVWDLQRTRDDAVLTLLRGTLILVPDVTHS